MSLTTGAGPPQARHDSHRSVPAEIERAMRGLDGALWLDPRLRELVAIRSAQLDGCAERLVEHARAALELGETPERLIALADRDRTAAFTEREQAALALADALACPDPSGVAEASRAAAGHFDSGEIAQLAFACSAAAAWDRFVLALGALSL